MRVDLLDPSTAHSSTATVARPAEGQSEKPPPARSISHADWHDVSNFAKKEQARLKAFRAVPEQPVRLNKTRPTAPALHKPQWEDHNNYKQRGEDGHRFDLLDTADSSTAHGPQQWLHSKQRASLDAISMSVHTLHMALLTCMTVSSCTQHRPPPVRTRVRAANRHVQSAQSC